MAGPKQTAFHFWPYDLCSLLDMVTYVSMLLHLIYLLIQLTLLRNHDGKDEALKMTNISSL